MKIYKVEEITDQIVVAFERLIPQLADDLQASSRSGLEALIATESSILFLAEIDDCIVGTVTLLISMMPSGKKGRIEDVIVDAQVRGKGVAMAMMQVVIDYAREAGIHKLDLTSNPQRVAAHKLYEKCGFVKRETSIFRLELK